MGEASDLFQLVRVYWSLLLGNMIEWYEYAVYGYLAVYLEDKFFNGSAVGVWLGFGITFFARPIGGIVLGTMGDRFGRSFAVNVSLVGMLLCTVGQGLLPTSSDRSSAWIGNFSLGCLIVLRFLQGLFAAGEIATITTYVTEVASKRCICRGLSLIGMSANVGFLAAKATVYGVHVIFGPAAVDAWAWRLPFIAALLPGSVAIWGRRGLPESDHFLDVQVQVKGGGHEGTVAKIRSTLASHWRGILVGAGSTSAHAMVLYGAFVWGQSFLQHAGMSEGDCMTVGLISRCAALILELPIGWLADHVGIGWLMLGGAVSMITAGLPLWSVIARHPTDLTTVGLAMGVGFGIINALADSIPFCFVVELFPTAVRSTAMGTSWNLGLAIFGGLTPMLMQASLDVSPSGPGLLFTLGGAVTLLSILAGLLLERAGYLTLAHIRPVPYLSCRGSEQMCRSGKLEADIVGNSSSSMSMSSSESVEEEVAAA